MQEFLNFNLELNNFSLFCVCVCVVVDPRSIRKVQPTLCECVCIVDPRTITIQYNTIQYNFINPNSRKLHCLDIKYIHCTVINNQHITGSYKTY